MQTRWRLAKNALANLIRGGTSAVVALCLPAVLVRHMSQIDYSVWVLVLQVAAYSGYLEFGLQTAVGRYIAVSKEKNDTQQRDTIFSTALTGLSVAAVLGIVLLIGVACAARWLFPSVPPELLSQMRWALLIVGTSIALGLPSAAWSGVFIGLQRNELNAIVTGGSKLISAFGLIVAAIRGCSLVQMAAVVAIVNLASFGLQYVLVRKFSEASFVRSLVLMSTARELFGYCFGLMVWTFSTMLVVGLDLILVGRFELRALAPYALAATLVTFIGGMQNAIFGAMMPHAAVTHAGGDSVALGKMVLRSTRLGVLLLLLTGMPLMVYARPLLQLWVGRQYAGQGYALLLLLLVANIIRQSGTPYAVVLVASAQQKLIILSPLMEGISNLVASIALGIRFGAAGVAAGTLIGAIIGMLGHVFYNLRRTRTDIEISVGDFVLSGILLPLISATPLAVVLVRAWRGSPPTTLNFAFAMGAMLLLSTAIIFHGERRTQI